MNLLHYQSVIREFGAALAEPDMEADASGYLNLTIDDLQIHLQYDDESDDVIVFAEVLLLPLDQDRKVKMYEQLLSANLFWQGTKGGTFGIDFDLGWIYLANRCTNNGLELKTFEAWLESFVNLAIYWRQRLESEAW